MSGIVINGRTVTEKEIDRFWSRVDIREEDDCWEWQAGRNSRKKGFDTCPKAIRAPILNDGSVPDYQNGGVWGWAKRRERIFSGAPPSQVDAPPKG